MPRYFFHLYNDIEAHDEEGTLLPNDEAARAKAFAEARQMMAVELRQTGVINLSHWIEVADDLGETIAIVKFGDAVTIKP